MQKHCEDIKLSGPLFVIYPDYSSTMGHGKNVTSFRKSLLSSIENT